MKKFGFILIIFLILFCLMNTSLYFKLLNIIKASRFTNNIFVDKTVFKTNPLNSSSSNCIHDHFKSTLLIIVYNSPLYSHLPLLKNLYSNGFPNIIHCGPEHSTAPSGILKSVTSDGYFTYEECAAQTMRTFINYTGYLVINDDLFLNFLTIKKLNLSKIWEGPLLEDNSKNISDWYWWDSSWGVKNCFKALKKLRSLNKYVNQKRDSYWHKIVSGENVCYGIRADIYYIPRKMAENFTKLSNVFREENVFLEIAVPTIIRLLVTEVERLNGFYMDSGTKSEVILKSYNSDLNFIHPVKFHYGEDSLINFEFLKNYERHVSC
nr:uncharacterized protein LOC105843530 [Hydra vulgaris]